MKRSQTSGVKPLPTGIEALHSRLCTSRTDGKCNCKPSYRAFVYDRRSSTKIRRTFSTLAAAKAWREDARSLQRKGLLAAPSRRTLSQAAEEWLSGAKAEPPTVMNRSELPYKPSVIRGYEAHLRRHVLDDLGAHKLSDIRRGDLQQLVDRLRGRGLGPSTVRNIINAVRVIFRHAVERGYVDANPTAGLRLGNGIGHRTRAASAEEAADLLSALPNQNRTLWATAFYAGLRRGELRAMRWDDIDLATGTITVRRGWDDIEGEITPKSAKGVRTVPIIGILRDYLIELKELTARSEGDFVFGATANRPFSPSHIRSTAAAAWAAENLIRDTRGEKVLDPIGLHECRHTFVSLMHDAGLSLERIGDYVGHSSTYMTDRYRHLLKGHEAETRRIMDDYLARADSRSRIDQVENKDSPS